MNTQALRTLMVLGFPVSKEPELAPSRAAGVAWDGGNEKNSSKGCGWIYNRHRARMAKWKSWLRQRGSPKMKIVIPLLLCCVPFLTHAQLQPKSTSYYDASFDGVISQFVDGASWKTIVTLVNLDSTPSTYTLKFYADNGTSMVIQTTAGTGSVITGTLPVGGSQVIETTGGKSTLSQGWALLQSLNTIGGSAIFRQIVAGRPDYEASLPIVTYVNAKRYVLPFDHTNSATGVALVNPLSYTSITVYATFRDEGGTQFLLDSFTLGALQHTAFSLSDRYPQSAGKTRRGRVRNQWSHNVHVGVALRARIVYVCIATYCFWVVNGGMAFGQRPCEDGLPALARRR